MKNLSPCLLLALTSIIGCGAAVDDTDAEGLAGADAIVEEEGAGADEEELASTLEGESSTEEGGSLIGTSRQALISGGAGGVSAKPWCAARKECYDQCDRDYPSGGGPRTTCKQICDLSTASKCRPGLTGGGAAVIF